MGIKLNLRQIERKCKDFAKEIWNVNFDIPIRISNRMTRALGMYYFKNNWDGDEIIPKEIVFSGYLVSYGYYDEKVIDSVIKHELTHWYLSTINKPFNDHHPVFENEIKRIGANSTNTITPAGNFHVGICSKCNKIIIKKRTYGRIKRYLNEERFRTKCCGKSIVCGGIMFFNDNNNLSSNSEGMHGNRSEVAASMQSDQHSISKDTLDINNIISPGPRGVTNAQMIPSIKLAIKQDNINNLKLLFNNFPNVFNSSIKYLNKNEKETLKSSGFLPN